MSPETANARAKQSQPEPATTSLESRDTGVGSVFVSNYPPYSAWSSDYIPQALAAIDADGPKDTPLGLYIHIPFCRKRCRFCYFKVYTDRKSREVEQYLDLVATEVELYSRKRSVGDRPLHFVYFGGGTPSYISSRHLRAFADRLRSSLPWDSAEEVTFECEPGTLTRSKLESIREIGVTRLSLGVESFDDGILEENGRAHRSAEIYRCLPWIREQNFKHVNIDLIAGMIGESWESWRATVRKAIDFDADSVTVYQLELPFNTVYSRHLLAGEPLLVADWETKREWNLYAIGKLKEAGFVQSSAYTMVKKNGGSDFVYRDSLWRGTEMIGAGVSSFGHLAGFHLQNSSDWGSYTESVAAGALPLSRAFKTTKDDRLIRELILQQKTGRLSRSYFRKKFGVDIRERFSLPFQRLMKGGLATIDEEAIRLTQKGLLQVDHLLPRFYDGKYRGRRYT